MTQHLLISTISQYGRNPAHRNALEEYSFASVHGIVIGISRLLDLVPVLADDVVKHCVMVLQLDGDQSNGEGLIGE